MSAEVTTERFDYEKEIWAVANLVWGPIKTSEFNRVILPFTMLRRLECALESTREAVIQAVEEHEAEWGRESDNYCTYSGKAFYNTTNFRLNSLGSTDTFEALMSYIDGFSENARTIMKRFKMEETCKTLDEHGMLYMVCVKFAGFNLSTDVVSDREMSNIYEHLIQKFGESIAENAEDFMTPKDIVRLAVGMLFANDDELMTSDTGIVRTLYDPTMGTGGFISDALDQLDEWHKDKKMTAPAIIVPYGQEYEPESWAMGKAAMLLRNVSNEDNDVYDQIKDMSSHIEYGDTLTDDKFEDMVFDYQLSNPPYGKSWTVQEEDVKNEARMGFAGRFGAGLPSIDDGSMLFLQHVVSKMKPEEDGGGKAGIVLSASPLFTGDAGSGPSNIRRWLFQKDVVDCIVKLPDSVFFRTNINTFLWILSTKKPENRKGMIQLIDASDCKTSIKNQGNKRYEVSEKDRQWIIDTYVNGHDHGKSVLVPVETFMFRKVTTQRPLKAVLRLSESNISDVLACKSLNKLSAENKAVLGRYLTDYCKGTNVPYETADTISKSARNAMEKPEVGAPVIAKAIRSVCIVRGADYPIVYDKNGNAMADPDMKDTENIPLNVSFEDYMNNDVLPYAPETWIDESVRDKGPLADGQIGVVGTSINFNKFFYHYEESRNPEEIAKEIMELESGLEELDYEGVSRMREMTMSGEVWIGNRPVDWEENKIKYVAPIHNERASTNEGYIGLENIESWTGKLLPSDSVATGESVAFQKNDVLFGKLRPYLAKSFLAKQSGCGSTELLVMRPDGISPEYLAYIMRSKTLVDCIDVSTYGAKMPRANGDFIKNLRVPLPPLSEQHTIVRYLDSKCAAIDEAIKRHRKIIEKLEEYRAEVVTNAVTGKIDCREA